MRRLAFSSVFVLALVGSLTVSVYSAALVTSATPSINALNAITAGLSQSVAPLNGSPFVLTVNGQDFASDAEITFGGTPLTTTVVSTTVVRAAIPTSALSAVGTINVGVRQKQDPSGNVFLNSNVVPLRVVERGDVNSSRTVNIGDALTIARSVAGLGGEPPFSVSVGDINLNDNVNIGDALTMALFSAGLTRNLTTPLITGVSPASVAPGATLTITGSGFGPASSDLQVAFLTSGSIFERVTPVLQNATTLTVTVPNTAVSGPIQIFRLDSPAGGQQFPLSVTGSSIPLSLTALEPLFTTTGGTLTLSGSGFVSPASDNAVYFRSAQGLTRGTVTAGTSASLTVTIPNDRTGAFSFRCAIPCGSGHRDMKGTIVVQP